MARAPTLFGFRASVTDAAGHCVWDGPRFRVDVYDSRADGGWVWLAELFGRSGVVLVERKSFRAFAHRAAACRDAERFLLGIEKALAQIGAGAGTQKLPRKVRR